MTKKEIQKELKSIKSSLELDDNKGYFEVSENYFDQMQKEVLNKVRNEAPSESVAEGNIIHRLSNKWAYAIAAVFIFAFGSLFLFNQNLQSSELDASNDIEAIVAYLEENIDEISIEMLVMDNGGMYESSFDQIDPGDIQEYLNENIEDIDFEDLESML